MVTFLNRPSSRGAWGTSVVVPLAVGLAGVKQQPLACAAGAVPTWEQVLRTIYQVRCNLLHGEKSPQKERDRRLILKSDRILRAAETGCLGWYDASTRD